MQLANISQANTWSHAIVGSHADEYHDSSYFNFPSHAFDHVFHWDGAQQGDALSQTGTHYNTCPQWDLSREIRDGIPAYNASSLPYHLTMVETTLATSTMDENLASCRSRRTYLPHACFPPMQDGAPSSMPIQELYPHISTSHGSPAVIPYMPYRPPDIPLLLSAGPIELNGGKGVRLLSPEIDYLVGGDQPAFKRASTIGCKASLRFQVSHRAAPSTLCPRLD